MRTCLVLPVQKLVPEALAGLPWSVDPNVLFFLIMQSADASEYFDKGFLTKPCKFTPPHNPWMPSSGFLSSYSPKNLSQCSVSNPRILQSGDYPELFLTDDGQQ